MTKNITQRTKDRLATGADAYWSASGTVSQGAEVAPKVIKCRYCKVAIKEGDENHYMRTCSALNLISEPVTRGEDGSIEMTPYAARNPGPLASGPGWQA